MLKKAKNRIGSLPWWGKGFLGIVGIGLVALGGYVGLMIYSQTQSNSVPYIRRWFNDESARPELTTQQLNEPCGSAPFLLPSSGLIGLLWNDPAGPYNLFHRHSGIDIFGDGEPGTVPVYAAYDGYLTREDNWISAVIIQHEDPLQPGRIIWSYYTHMADQDGKSFIPAEFPQGTRGKFVQQGELIGYQGEYNGASVRPIGQHLHFSIVLSEADGSYKNETDAGNTLDPSPYLGMNVNIESMPDRPIVCESQSETAAN